MLASDSGTYMDTQQALLLALMKKFDQLGVDTRTPRSDDRAPAEHNELAEFKARAYAGR